MYQNNVLIWYLGFILLEQESGVELSISLGAGEHCYQQVVGRTVILPPQLNTTGLPPNILPLSLMGSSSNKYKVSENSIVREYPPAIILT